MKTISFALLTFIALTLFVEPAQAQQPDDNHGIRFKPYAGLTYNLHTMKDITLIVDEGGYHYSHFPGIEFGFILDSKKENGWLLEYRNTFLGELAIYGIAKQTRNPYQGFLDDIVNRTISNGFLGRVDIGKSVIMSPSQYLVAGVMVSDKVILGAEDHWNPNLPLEDSYTKDGFHFTPGVYASYHRLFKNQSLISLNVSFGQSVFNLHQFGDENAIENFVLPMFTEILINYQMPGGIYLKTGTIIATSFTVLPADARISLGAGYTFRYN